MNLVVPRELPRIFSQVLLVVCQTHQRDETRWDRRIKAGVDTASALSEGDQVRVPRIDHSLHWYFSCMAAAVQKCSFYCIRHCMTWALCVPLNTQLFM